jgi:hypothetical protein
MRERSLLYLFLGLNVALAGAFFVYLFLSHSGQPEIVATTFPPEAKATNATNLPLAPLPAPAEPKATNLTVALPVPESAPLPATAANTNQVEPKPVFTTKKFTWEQVESDEYLKYLDSLRAVGCPEEKVRYIILADINELCAKRRIKEAVTHDTQWWRAEPELMPVNVLQEKGRSIEDQRRRLITKLLGPEALENEKGESLLWSSVQLTGPVLGSLSPEVHSQVQEICARSMERNQATYWARANGGQPMNPVELAKMREQTRVDLKQVLNAQELEEFLLRYSHNAQQLRVELHDLEPSPEEFRKIFRAIDPIDHQMQLEYGNKEAMSEKQRQRYERQRDDIFKEVLGPQRFELYTLTKDPLYRQAQMFAMQYGAPARAVLPIYQMTKANETRRQKIMQDSSLTPQQKSEEINAIYQKQQQSIQQIAAETKANQ